MQTLHKLKYQPSLQKSGFAPQSKSFRTTWELERCFAAIGIQVKAVQITPGELSGTFDIYGSSSLPIFSLHTNQGLVVEGDRNPQMTIVGLEQTDNIALHRVRGETLNPSSIHGFSSRIKDAYFQMSPGAHTTMAIFKKQRLQDLALFMGRRDLLIA